MQRNTYARRPHIASISGMKGNCSRHPCSSSVARISAHVLISTKSPTTRSCPNRRRANQRRTRASARGRRCLDCSGFTGSVQLKKKILLAKRTALVPNEHDRAGTRKRGGAQRDEHTQCGHDGTEDLRKPIQAEESEQQRHGNEHAGTRPLSLRSS